MNNIFVGNLSFKATKEDVVKLFEPFGTVANTVIMERKKGKSRGYGFVDMPNEEEKNAAIAALAGKEFMWRVLSVSPVIPKVKGESKPKHFKSAKKEWQPREDRPSRPESTSEGKSKYYSKFDGPPKPWRKVNPDSKPARKDNQGSRPYYGKKERESKGEGFKPFSKDEGQSNKDFKPFRQDSRGSKPWIKSSSGPKSPYKKFDGPSKPLAKRTEEYKTFDKPSKGFKMLHKVSGVSRVRPKNEQAEDRRPL